MLQAGTCSQTVSRTLDRVEGNQGYRDGVLPRTRYVLYIGDHAHLLRQGQRDSYSFLSVVLYPEVKLALIRKTTWKQRLRATVL